MDREAESSVGKYHPFASLGRGGMADVFLAVARGPAGFQKLVVLKQLRGDLELEPEYLTMLFTEARLAARLNHPNVVQTLEVGDDHGTIFIAMEYLEGESLHGIATATQSAPLDAPWCARIVADALAGLHYVHELRDYDGAPLGVIHRDVSPHNVMVTYDGQVKLMDFGIAKAAVGDDVTEAGVLKGKVAYMSPEQAIASEIDRRSDVFSMGIVLWELLANRRMFGATPATQIIQTLLTAPMPRLSDANPSIDPRLDAIVTQALAKDPERRFPTAQAMRAALEGYIDASGAIVQREVIGARIAELFAVERARVRERIRKQVAELAVEVPSGRKIATMDASAMRMLRAAPPSGPTLADTRSSGSGALSTTSEASRRKTGGSGTAIALFALGIATVVLWYASHRDEGTVASASATPTAAGANVIDPPPALPSAATPTPAPPSAATSTPTPTSTPSSTSFPHPQPKPSVPAPPAPSGFLTFDTYPWSRVSENGHPLGINPLVHLALPKGAHVLTLETRAGGHADVHRRDRSRGDDESPAGLEVIAWRARCGRRCERGRRARRPHGSKRRRVRRGCMLVEVSGVERARGRLRRQRVGDRRLELAHGVARVGRGAAA